MSQDRWRSSGTTRSGSPAECRSRPTSSYLPFNIGPHRCIGASFATTEMLAVLAVIGQRVRLRPAAGHPVQIQVAVTQRPLNGLWMTVEPRAMATTGTGHG
jgi:cytochrome P450